MSTSDTQLMELLESNLISELPTFKRPFLRSLLRILDTFVKMESRRFDPARKLGQSTDGSAILELVEEVKYNWRRLTSGANPTEEELIMGLLDARDISVVDGWIRTPKGQFPTK